MLVLHKMPFTSKASTVGNRGSFSNQFATRELRPRHPPFYIIDQLRMSSSPTWMDYEKT